VLDWDHHLMDWSGGAADSGAAETVLGLLGDLDRALQRRLDRWEIKVTPGAVPSLKRDRQPVKFMMNYFGIGVDGKVGGWLTTGTAIPPRPGHPR
jgi:hypothetical protein